MTPILKFFLLFAFAAVFPDAHAVETSAEKTESELLVEKWGIQLNPRLQKQVIPDNLKPGAYDPWTMPSSTLISPIAWGANWGDVFASLSFQNRSRRGVHIDSAAGLGMGFGNANKSIGVELSYSLYDVSAIWPWAGNSSISIKLHRNFKYGWAAAFGVNDLVMWNGGDSGRSFYIVGSKFFILQPSENHPFSALMVHLGLGTGNFMLESDILARRSSVGIFASAALRIGRPVSLIVNWYGSDLGIGLSFTPFRHTRFVITPNIQDITGAAGDGARFMLTMGWSDNWKSPYFLFRSPKEDSQAVAPVPSQIRLPQSRF